MTVTEAVFWLSVALVGHGIVGYPLWMCLRARWTPRKIEQADIECTVTCVIAARNEGDTIGSKLANLLALDYPPAALDMVVVSDGSSDSTTAVVQAWAGRYPGRISLIRVPTGRGKAHALNLGVAAARGDVVLFADARQRFEPQAVRALVRNFADRSVGAVSGELLFEDDLTTGLGHGLGFYWRLEKVLRKAESGSGSTIGCTGAIYAVRRELLAPIPDGTLLDDVLVPIRIVLGGHRVIFEGSARAFDRVSVSRGGEFNRKVRTIAGNIQLLHLCPALLNPLRGAVAFRFFCHKLLPRVLMPYCLTALFLSNIALSGPWYRGALAAQVLCYTAAIAGLSLGGRGGRLLGYPSTFLLLNAAAIVAAIRYITGSTRDLWARPSRAPLSQRRPIR